VVILLFRPGTVVSPAKWPCPTSAEGTSGCHKRFWSDSSTRLANQSARREFGKTMNTFGCRFYQRLIGDSPCEGVAKPGFFQLQIVDDDTGRPLSDVQLSITQSSGVITPLVTDADGQVYIASAAPGVCSIASDFNAGTINDTYDYISIA